MKNIILLTYFLTSLVAQDQIEGRWHLVGYEDNVMYQFEDGYRYSIYSMDGNFGGLEDAGGSPNPYTVDDNVITIDLFFGTVVSYQMNYLCDGDVVEFKHMETGYVHSTLFREGYSYTGNDCEQSLEECFDFTDIDFGVCALFLGVGLSNDECSYISGCDWTIDGFDYSNLFFESIEECEQTCSLDSECLLTTDDILGPYYFEGAPFRNVIAHEDEPGQRLYISGKVHQNNCQDAISGSMIELWQANDAGCYGIVEDCDTGNPEDDYFNLRGKFFSDEDGTYMFESILPGYYGSRPRHIHIKITTPSNEVLISQLYFEGDIQCENDPWCQEADGRIIALDQTENGLSGELDLIMNSSDGGVLLGDLNFDSTTNVQDVVILVSIIIDGMTANDFQVFSGDLNSDSNIDILDIVHLVNIILND